MTTSQMTTPQITTPQMTTLRFCHLGFFHLRCCHLGCYSEVTRSPFYSFIKNFIHSACTLVHSGTAIFSPFIQNQDDFTYFCSILRQKFNINKLVLVFAGSAMRWSCYHYSLLTIIAAMCYSKIQHRLRHFCIFEDRTRTIFI
jgi:hypothetical protein